MFVQRQFKISRQRNFRSLFYLKLWRINVWGHLQIISLVISSIISSGVFLVTFENNASAQKSLSQASSSGSDEGKYQQTSQQPIHYDLDSFGAVRKLKIVRDQSETIRVERSYSEALVANEKIADVVPLSNYSMYILGKQIGTTRITIFDDDKSLLGILEISVTHDIENLRSTLRREVFQSNIEVSSINGGILLSGTVPDALALQKALAIASRFAPKEMITNSLNVKKIKGSQQVLLEVRFVEASRNAARELGISWAYLSKNFVGITGSIVKATAGAGVSDLLVKALPFPSNDPAYGTAAVSVYRSDSRSVDAVIQLLEQKGLARRLAEPNLVALSGDTANFLAGGEFPFPVDAGDNKISVEFKKFGVGLAFTPTVLGDGLINLKVEPEVSEIDQTNCLRTTSGNVCSLIVRQASTTIELRDGQSFAMAGLLSTTNIKAKEQLPWVGSVPVLGTLFSSASYQKRETDLVIIITPRLVQPATPDKKLLTPLDKSFAANDIDFFIRQRLEIRKHWPAPYGHMLEFDDGWEGEVILEKSNGIYK